MSRYCKRHAKPVGWQCTTCEELLCPECVASKRAQTVTLNVCLECGNMAELLTRHRRDAMSYPLRVLTAAWWPLLPAGLITAAGLALFRSVTSYLPVIGWWFGICALAAVCFGILRATARGNDDGEMTSFTDFFSDLMLPGIKAMVGVAIVWAPAIIWVAKMHAVGAVTDVASGQKLAVAVLGDPVMWVLLLLGVTLAPMAIIVGASGGSIFRMLNPLLLSSYAFLLGWSYLFAVAVMVALVVPGVLLLGVGAVLSAKIPIPFLPRVIDYTLACYVPFVAARVLGLLIYTHGDRIEYGLDSDYRVALLPGVEPRGVLPAGADGSDLPMPEAPVADGAADAPARDKFAPIELPDEPPEAPEVAEQPLPPPRPRITELDPALLPVHGPSEADQIREALKRHDAANAVSLWRASPEKPPAGLEAAELVELARQAAAANLSDAAIEVLTEVTVLGGAAAPRAQVLMARLYADRFKDFAKSDALLKEVVQRYPGTDAARMATTYLKSRA